MRETSSASDETVSILTLPSVLINIFARAQRPLLSGVQGSARLFVRYLRRKPERGLAVIYSVDEPGATPKTRQNDPSRAVSLTIAEQALDGARIRFNAAQAQEAPIEILPSGVLRAQDIGIAVQAFPADEQLPALAASCDTTAGGILFQALQAAAQVHYRDTRWRLLAAEAVPVRYKPGSRCVIRYHLHLQQAAITTTLTLFGKVYADPAQAQNVQALQKQLYEEQKQTGDIALLPQPLGMIESLGLTLNEAVQYTPGREEQSAPWDSLRTGTRALQPQLERGRGGSIEQIILPETELRLTAQALAKLHNSAVRPNEQTPRTGKKEAKRARERAALIARHNPAQAEQVQQLAQQLSARLETLQPPVYRPAHGGFKASQLLFHSQRVFVVDFDGFCLADPALDAGYFLAYLRPSGLWYQQQGTRAWFEAAAEIFRAAYNQAMLEHGITPGEIAGINKRSRLYEAALLFKIATRRVNRLNSPRAQELAAMLAEITVSLASEEEGQHVI